MADLSDIRSETQDAPNTPDAQAPAPAPGMVVVWRAIFVGILLLFVVLLAWRLWDTNRSEHRASGMAPPFTFTTFEGETISLDDLQGQGVVVNFWASWCDPCRDEAALLEQAWRREKDNGIVAHKLRIIWTKNLRPSMLAEFDITYEQAGPAQRAARRYGIKGVPETFFINSAGEIAQTVARPNRERSADGELSGRDSPLGTPAEGGGAGAVIGAHLCASACSSAHVERKCP